VPLPSQKPEEQAESSTGVIEGVHRQVNTERRQQDKCNRPHRNGDRLGGAPPQQSHLRSRPDRRLGKPHVTEQPPRQAQQQNAGSIPKLLRSQVRAVGRVGGRGSPSTEIQIPPKKTLPKLGVPPAP